MSRAPQITRSSTRDLRPDLTATIAQLKPGDRIRIRQKVQINTLNMWDAETVGTFRHVNYLSTGLATDRVKKDDIVVVCLHFTKDNQELSSITLDEHTQIERAV